MNPMWWDDWDNDAEPVFQTRRKSAMYLHERSVA